MSDRYDRLREAAQTACEYSQGEISTEDGVCEIVPADEMAKLRAALDAEPEAEPSDEKRARGSRPDVYGGLAPWCKHEFSAPAVRCNKCSGWANLADTQAGIDALLAAERERTIQECADVAWNHANKFGLNGFGKAARGACRDCAAAIRALDDK